MKKVILVGHTSGLGLALTKLFIEKGIEVVGVTRSASDYQADGLTEIKADMEDTDQVAAAVAEIKKDHRKFDCVIYNAGTLTVHGIDSIEAEELQRVYQVNVLAAMQFESALLPLIKENEADVVNVTSSGTLVYYPNYTEYTTSKTALSRFTSDLQKELQPTKSRVIDLCPSGFQSEIYKKMTGDKIDRDESVQMKAEDLAELLHYILRLPKKIEIAHVFVNRK